VTMPATDVLPLCFTYKLTPALDGVTAGTITVGMALIGTTNSLSLKTPSARIAHNVDADSTGVQVKLSTAGFFDATKLAEEKFKPFGNPWSTQAASFYFSSSKPTKDTQIAITASIDCTKSDCTGYLNAGMKFAVYAAVQDDLCTTDCSRMGCSGTKCDEFGHCTNTAMYRCENKDNSTNPNAAAFTAAGVALPVAAMTMMNML
jgi:hypothetical protein